MHKFWRLESRSRMSSLSLGIFDEVSVSKFQPGLGLKGYGLDYITDRQCKEHFWNKPIHSSWCFAFCLLHFGAILRKNLFQYLLFVGCDTMMIKALRVFAILVQLSKRGENWWDEVQLVLRWQNISERK